MPVDVALFALVLIVVGWVGVVVVRRLVGLDRAALRRARAEEEAASRTATALDAAGALPERPVVVESAAAVEPRAAATPCPVCDGPCHVHEHASETIAGDRLRRVAMRCGSCGRRSDLYFRISAPRSD